MRLWITKLGFNFHNLLLAPIYLHPTSSLLSFTANKSTSTIFMVHYYKIHAPAECQKATQLQRDKNISCYVLKHTVLITCTMHTLHPPQINHILFLFVTTNTPGLCLVKNCIEKILSRCSQQMSRKCKNRILAISKNRLEIPAEYLINYHSYRLVTRKCVCLNICETSMMLMI